MAGNNDTISLNTLLTGIQTSIIDSNKKNSENYISNFSSYFSNSNDILVPTLTKFAIPKINVGDIQTTINPLPVGSIMLNNKNVRYEDKEWNLYKTYNPETKEVNNIVYEVANGQALLSNINKFNEQIKQNDLIYDNLYGKYDKTLYNILFKEDIYKYNWLDYTKNIAVNIFVNLDEYSDENNAKTEINNLNNVKLNFSDDLESHLRNYVSLPSEYDRVDVLSNDFFSIEEANIKKNLENGEIQDKIFYIVKDIRHDSTTLNNNPNETDSTTLNNNPNETDSTTLNNNPNETDSTTINGNPNETDNNPNITITSPKNGDILNGPIKIEFLIENFKVSDGHIHISIDDTNNIMYYDLENPYIVNNLTEGSHTIRLKLVNNSHKEIGVEDFVTFYIDSNGTINTDPNGTINIDPNQTINIDPNQTINFNPNISLGLDNESNYTISSSYLSHDLSGHYIKLSIKSSIDLGDLTDLTDEHINNLDIMEWTDAGVRTNAPGDNYFDAEVSVKEAEYINDLISYREKVKIKLDTVTNSLYSLGFSPGHMHFPQYTTSIPVIQLRGTITELKTHLEAIKNESFVNKFFYVRHPDQLEPQAAPLLDVSDIMSDNTADKVVDVQGWKATNIRVGVFEGSPGNETKNGITYTGYSNIAVEEYYDSSKDPGSSSHATTVIGIIKNTSSTDKCFAPDAKIYSANDYSYDSLEWAITGKECRVINQSFHETHEVDSGELSWEDILKDYLVLHYPYPFITSAAGNYSSTPETSSLSVGSDEYCNHKGYNYICVGNHNDFDSSGNPNGMRSSSVFRNPDSSHNDRELPEICANGTSVSLFGESRGSGTSFSSPAVAGAAALLQNMDNLLLYWPEGIRAILFSGATENIVDNNWSLDVGSNIDGKDGVGALDTNTSGKIAQKRSSKNNSPCPRGWHYGTVNDSVFGDDNLTTYSYWIGVPYNFNDKGNTKRNVKVALAWNSEIINYKILGIDTGIRKSSDLKLDLDLEVYDESGNLVGYSNTWDNSYEVVEFMGNVNEKYEIKIRRWSGEGHSSYYGIAWNAGDGIYFNYKKILVPYDITNLNGYISGSLSSIVSSENISSNNNISLSSATGNGAVVATATQNNSTILTLLDGGADYQPTDALMINTNNNDSTTYNANNGLTINSNVGSLSALNTGTNISYPESTNVSVVESIANTDVNISKTVSVPNATLSSHKQLNIDNLDVNFNVDINSITNTDILLNKNTGVDNGNISLKISSTNEPESVSRLMDYLQNNI